jgi:hypothetical protein
MRRRVAHVLEDDHVAPPRDRFHDGAGADDALVEPHRVARFVDGVASRGAAVPLVVHDEDVHGAAFLDAELERRMRVRVEVEADRPVLPHGDRLQGAEELRARPAAEAVRKFFPCDG